MVNLFSIFLILSTVFSTESFFLNTNNPKRNFSLMMANDDYELAKEYYDYKTKKSVETYFFNKNLENSDLSDDEYVEFAKSNEKNYRIFSKNWFTVKDHNKKNNFKLELNKFADSIDFGNNELPSDLMKCSDNFDIPKRSWYKNMFKKVKSIFQNHPREVDWRKTNFLTEVKNQGQCGSCWAFSSTSALEAFLKKNKLKVSRLSEQELVDCSKENYGCQGGLMDLAFDYCIENNGLHSDENYPYNARNNRCLKGCSVEGKSCNITDKVPGSGNFTYEYTIPYSVNSMKEAVIKNPVSIAINANTPVFRFYSEGIVEDLGDNIPDQINHAVLLVGYSYDKNGMYWIIQNSWGKDWGDKGFIKIRSKEGSGILSCQIYGVYPLEKS